MQKEKQKRKNEDIRGPIQEFQYPISKSCKDGEQKNKKRKSSTK